MIARPSPGKNGEISLSPRDHADKLATRDLIEAVGGFEAAAMFCRLGKSHLHRCCDPATGDFLPIDAARELEAVARGKPGWPHVTTLHARELGQVLMPLPEIGACDSTCLHSALAEAIREFSDVSARLMQALGDGKCDRAEARGLTQDCTEAAEAVMRLRALLERICGDQ